MLKHLTIKNYALIRELELDFDEGFTVITGETGTGKSIVLGALDMILGKRADSGVLFDPSAKCVVEATFLIDTYNLGHLFLKHDLDYLPQTIIRREISAQGSSRAFVNDTPVNLGILQELSGHLVDIHSQHQNLSLSDAEFQAFILDSYAGILPEVRQYRKDYQQFLTLNRELLDLTEAEQKSRTEKDYLEFQYNELEKAGLKKDEQELLEEELKMLDHAGEIRSILFSTIQGIENERGGVLPDLGAILSGLEKIKTFTPFLTEINHRFEILRIELKDILREVELFENQVYVDPGRTAEITERLGAIYNLQQKHRVNSIAALHEVGEELKHRLNGIGNLEKQIAEITGTIEILKKKISTAAGQISGKRKKIAGLLEKEIISLLVDLGMPNARFKVEIADADVPGKDGQDKIAFIFSANRGSDLKMISKVASGGEKSRLMLAIKSLLSRKAFLPTIIFDEIDTGVSGAVADRVGGILQSLSQVMQVIAITHLPQIAGKGAHHYQAFKNVEKDTTTTHLRKLSTDERIFEIAKLLSGQEVTNASVESARHLLNN